MADKIEVEVKALRGMIETLSRRVEALEKTGRAAPDTGALGKIASRVEELAKAVANKKDLTPAHEQAIKASAKLSAEQQALMKEMASKAQLETRFAQLQGQIAQAMALAASAAKK